AKIAFPSPEFSGELTFRAWTVSNRSVGYDEESKKIKEDFILETTDPRALSPGDTVAIPFSLISNVDREISPKVENG
ncbi:MAG: alpha-2-macroglobulin family protein, partial [bacterium]